MDPTELRTTVSHFASGLVVISGLHEQRPVGFTCQSFASVSLDPPLVSFSVRRTSTTYRHLRTRGVFAVNVLSSRQVGLSHRFATAGAERWGPTAWEPARSGNPVLEGALAWLDCRIWAEHDAGDHLIVVGHVIETGVDDTRSADPLLYFRSAYRALGRPA